MVTPELKKCTNIKNLLGPKSFLIPAKIGTAPTFLEVLGKRFQLQLFKESSE